MATFGLERVEAGLRRDAFSPADVDEFLRRADTDRAETPASANADRAPRTPPRRVEQRDTPTDGFLEPVSAPGLTAGGYFATLANTEFRQTRHADRV